MKKVSNLFFKRKYEFVSLLFLLLASQGLQAQTPWSITGNSAGANDFIGTTNNIPFVVKTNNAEALRVMPGGVVGIGVVPSAGDYSMKLRVGGSTHITAGATEGDVLVLAKPGLTTTNGTHYMYFSHRKFSDNVHYSVITAYEYGSYGIPKHLILQEQVGGNLGIGTFTTQPVSKLSVNGTSYLNGKVGINTSPESSVYALSVNGGTYVNGRVGLNIVPEAYGTGSADVAIGGVTRITASGEGGDALRLRMAAKNHYMYLGNRAYDGATGNEFGFIGVYEYTTSGTPKDLLIQDQSNGGNLGIGYFATPPASKFSVNGRSYMNGRVGINVSPEATTSMLTVGGTTQLNGRVGLNTAPDAPGDGTADVAINGVTRITANAEGGDAFRLRLSGPKNHYVYIANRLFASANTIEYGAIGAYEYTTSGIPKHLLIQDQYNGGNLGIGYFAVPPTAKLTVNGNMCIGDNYVPTGYMLAVKGKVIAEEIAVKLRSKWGDFVFEPDFKLMKLSEVESYIKSNKHLPGVPSAVDLETKGLELGEMENILMQKVEQLTLYAIEQDKTIELQKQKDADQQAKIDQLLKLIEAQNVRLEKLENK